MSLTGPCDGRCIGVHVPFTVIDNGPFASTMGGTYSTSKTFGHFCRAWLTDVG